ncbi:hypothetical protein [Streptomyces incanus]|uniref:LapB rubredoxin metal binding domain-containing protein n=1 Tax=Streptomyces incanus TaxID=887453 RepID=A0ABW0XFN8_9ACTN
MAARSRTTIAHRPSYRCTECGWTTAKWLGRCPNPPDPPDRSPRNRSGGFGKGPA